MGYPPEYLEYMAVVHQVRSLEDQNAELSAAIADAAEQIVWLERELGRPCPSPSARATQRAKQAALDALPIQTRKES